MIMIAYREIAATFNFNVFMDTVTAQEKLLIKKNSLLKLVAVQFCAYVMSPRSFSGRTHLYIHIFRAPPLGGCPIVITLSVCPSVCLSANFNIEYNFFTVTDRAFIFGMSVPYDKTFPTVP